MKIAKMLIVVILLLCFTGCDSNEDSYRANTCAQDGFSSSIHESVLKELNCSFIESEKDMGAYVYFYSCYATGPTLWDEYSGDVTVTLPSNGDTGSWRVSLNNMQNSVYSGECN
jgi:hypothetical protein